MELQDYEENNITDIWDPPTLFLTSFLPTIPHPMGYDRKQQRDLFGVSGIKDPNSAGARRVMRSSGRLTRTVALVKSKYKTWIVSAC